MKKIMILVMVLTLIFTSSLMAQTNLALSGTATASSSDYGWIPSNGIDNNVSTGYHSMEIAALHWFEVDLGQGCQIDSVEIVNRAGFLARLNGAIVKLLDANRNVLYTSEPVAGSPATAVFDTTAVQSKNIRFVRVEKDSAANSPLTIMELRAFGIGNAATNIAPVDKLKGILVDKNATGELSPTLQWAPSDNIDNGTVTGYFVFFGQDETAVTQAAQGDAVMLGSSYITGTSYQHTANLEKDKTYYWRVDTRLQNDPNSIFGKVWSFDTELTLPQIITQPKNFVAPVGSDAIFSVVAEDPLGGDLTYQWWADPNLSVVGDEYVLTEGSKFSGVNSDTLTISNIDDSDVSYYYCVISNGQTQITGKALLIIGRLQAHWPFDGNTNDTVASWNAVPAVEGKTHTYEAGIKGGQAIRFVRGTSDRLIVPGSEEYFNFFTNGLTVNIWVKPDDYAYTNGFMGLISKEAGGAGWRIFDTAFYYGQGAEFNIRNVGGYNLPTGRLDDGQWHMITITFDYATNTASAYQNGTLRGTPRTGNISAGNAAPITIGSLVGGEWGYNGLIDDVKIFNYPLSPNDIATMYVESSDVDWVCVEPIPADFNGDCIVDILDLSIFVADWMASGLYPLN